MGGLVFANMKLESGKPVTTPRISPDLYKQVASTCQAQLETVFERVVIPREAPAKADHGDVDYLVGGVKPNVATGDNVWKKLKEVLGADVSRYNGGSHSYAVPHPETPDTYVQVDVELAPGDGTPNAAELYEWTRFMKGDADLLQILGASHRWLGVTCNDKGLHVRVEEIEAYDRKKSMILLTRNPNEVMEFYGLDSAKYWAGFNDETELFDWATSGRFFYPKQQEKLVETANDRARVQKRSMYNRFANEYMVANPLRGASNDWTRKQVLQEALTEFDKQKEYDAVIGKYTSKQAEEVLWKEMSTAIPANTNLVNARKALRRWVIFENGMPQIAAMPILDEAPVWTKLMAPGSKDELLAWVTKNCEEAKRLEKQRATAARKAGLAG